MYLVNKDYYKCWIEWYHFRWPWVTHNPGFKVTVCLQVEYLKNDALSRVVSEISNVKKCRDLEIRVRGHSRSSNVVAFDRLGMVSY